MTITKLPTTEVLVDAMQNCDRWVVATDGCHGICALVDVMPRLVPAGRSVDSAVVRDGRDDLAHGAADIRRQADHSHENR